jgi:hypothetical protein
VVVVVRLPQSTHITRPRIEHFPQAPEETGPTASVGKLREGKLEDDRFARLRRFGAYQRRNAPTSFLAFLRSSQQPKWISVECSTTSAAHASNSSVGERRDPTERQSRAVGFAYLMTSTTSISTTPHRHPEDVGFKTVPRHLERTSSQRCGRLPVFEHIDREFAREEQRENKRTMLHDRHD